MLNMAAFTGRLTADPELKKTESGISVCSFTIAVDRNYVKQGEERKADFIPVVAWRQGAEFVSKHFSKGQMIGVTGEIQTRRYEDKNGNMRTITELVARDVSFCGEKPEKKIEIEKSEIKPTVVYDPNPPAVYEVPEEAFPF